MNFLPAFEYSFNQFKYQICKVRRSNSADAVHDFRVAYKKIVALNKFINFASKEIPENTFIKSEDWIRRTRKIYQKGGKSRKYYLIRKWLEENNENYCDTEFINNVKFTEEEKNNKFYLYIQTTKIPSAVNYRKFVSKCSDELINSDLFDNYLNENLIKAVEYLSEAPSDSWHEARRMLKDCYLLSSMTCFPYSASADVQLLCREMEQHLGKWHDLEVLKKFLNKCNKMKTNWQKSIASSCYIYDQELKSNISVLKQII